MNKRLLLSIAVGVMALACVFAAVNYFYTNTVDLTVNEARSSADIPFSLTFNSGETVTQDLHIANAGNTQLCAELAWVETSNEDGVTYTNNMPVTITLAPLDTTTQTVSFTADEITEAGPVSGTIYYNKVRCP